MNGTQDKQKSESALNVNQPIGTKKKRKNPYKYIYLPNYPSSGKNGSTQVHTFIAEKALGKRLPRAAVIHHFDGNGSNNANSNLVICENKSYHKLLHSRAKAYKLCGNANWHHCWICDQYDNEKNLHRNGATWFHHSCYNDYHREWKFKKNKSRV
jgi:hypothetical protein